MKFWRNTGKGFMSLAALGIFFGAQIIVQFAILGFIVAAVAVLSETGDPFAELIRMKIAECYTGSFSEMTENILAAFGEVIYFITFVSQIAAVAFLFFYYKKRVAYRAPELGGAAVSFKTLLLAVFLGLSSMLTVVFVFDITGYMPLYEATEMPGTFCLLAVIIGAPLSEELTFRGFIFGRMRDRGVGIWFTIIFTGVVFGLIHGNLEQISYAIPFGILIGAFRAKYDNLWLCMIIHCCANFAGSFPYARLSGMASQIIVHSAPVVLLICLFIMIADKSDSGLFGKKEAVQAAEV